MRLLILLSTFWLPSLLAAVTTSVPNSENAWIEDRQHVARKFPEIKNPQVPDPLHVFSIGEGSGESSRQLALCDRCHSAALYSKNSFMPILAGQNRDYLYAKILFFKHNTRSFHPMRGVTATLGEDQILAISDYYSALSSTLGGSLMSGAVEPGPGEESAPDLLRCLACHDMNGKGNSLIPVIAGQNESYLAYRIREIAARDSRIHLHGIAPVDCEIPALDIAQSRVLAQALARVLDSARVARGEKVYALNCSRCHDNGDQGAPKLSDVSGWHQRIGKGVREMVRTALPGQDEQVTHRGNRVLSRNQLTDAIHYMIHRIGSYKTRAPN